MYGQSQLSLQSDTDLVLYLVILIIPVHVLMMKPSGVYYVLFALLSLIVNGLFLCSY